MDLRITYICACCGGFAEVSFWEIEALDSGTTLTCDKCGGKTVFGLFTVSEYSRTIQAAAQQHMQPTSDPAAESASQSAEGGTRG